MEAAERRRAALVIDPWRMSVRFGHLLIVMGTALMGMTAVRLEESLQGSNEGWRTQSESGAAVARRVPPCHPSYNDSCTRSCPYSAFS
jgi:hypothetical protein